MAPSLLPIDICILKFWNNNELCSMKLAFRHHHQNLTFLHVSFRNCPLVAVLRTFFAAASAENKKAKRQDEGDFIGGGSGDDEEL